MSIIEQIEKYKCINEQDIIRKKAIISFVKNNSDCLFRTNLIAHLTSSAVVLNKTMTKMLMEYHNIFKSYGWCGGHMDGMDDFLKVAIKETKEETSIKEVYPITEDILSLDILPVNDHYKNNKFIPAHLHLNTTYCLIADEGQFIKPKLDENSSVIWVDVESIKDVCCEEELTKIYYSVIAKAKKYLKK